MPRGISRLLRNRPGSAPAVMVFLLAIAGLAGDSALVSTLRGFSIANEARQAPTLGYYEGLINAPGREIGGDGQGFKKAGQVVCFRAVEARYQTN